MAGHRIVPAPTYPEQAVRLEAAVGRVDRRGVCTVDKQGLAPAHVLHDPQARGEGPRASAALLEGGQCPGLQV